MPINYKLGIPKWVDNGLPVDNGDNTVSYPIIVNIIIQNDVHGFVPGNVQKRFTTATVSQDNVDFKAIKIAKNAAAQALLTANFPDVV